MLPCFDLKEGRVNELTRHPKDHGKDRLNSRTNSLQHGENDVDQIEFWSLSITTHDPAIEHPPTVDRTLDCAQAHMGPYVNFLRFSYYLRLYFLVLVVLGFWESLFHYFIRFRVIGVFM
jgi:hypothetical protein